MLVSTVVGVFASQHRFTTGRKTDKFTIGFVIRDLSHKRFICICSKSSIFVFDSRGSAQKVIKEFKDVTDRFADILQNKTNVKKHIKVRGTSFVTASVLELRNKLSFALYNTVSIGLTTELLKNRTNSWVLLTTVPDEIRNLQEATVNSAAPRRLFANKTVCGSANCRLFMKDIPLLFFQYFTKTMERRMSYIDEKRKILASNTSQFFTRHLSQRGFSGYIKFDHNRESLELIVSDC